MSKDKYKYHFPENLILKDGLQRGDTSVIASNTGYKKRTVDAMLNGNRKMKSKVKDECLRISQINSEKLKLS